MDWFATGGLCDIWVCKLISI